MRFIPLVLIAAIGCESPPSEIDQMRDLWRTEGAETYQITVQRSCFCPDVDPIRVTVVDGEPTAAERLILDAPEAIDPADFEPWFTVEGLFDVAEEALADADDVEVTYDPDTGYPTLVDIDWVTNAVDDEVSYAAFDLDLTSSVPQPEQSR